MIQKKKFSDAIAANISVVGELIGVATSTKDGLVSKENTPILASYAFSTNKKWKKITKLGTALGLEITVAHSDANGKGVLKGFLSISPANYIASNFVFYNNIYGDSSAFIVIKEDNSNIYIQNKKGGGAISKYSFQPYYFDNYEELHMSDINETELPSDATEVPIS